MDVSVNKLDNFRLSPLYDNTKTDTGVSQKKTMRAIGVFWDIENCQVPKLKSAIAVVQRIRETFFEGYREAEFVCVCDANKENKKIIQELNEAQVTVVHVNATAKNAADDKLCQLMRRFCNLHSSGAAVVLISGDVNFATELFDIRYRNNMSVFIVHNGNASEALLASAHRHISFRELVVNVADKTPAKSQESSKSLELCVTNLPEMVGKAKIMMKLSQLSENCGGKIVKINGSQATLTFVNQDVTTRAKKRMDGEDVYGNKISVNYPTNSEGKKPQSAKPKSLEMDYQSSARAGIQSKKQPNPPINIPAASNGANTTTNDLALLAWNSHANSYPNESHSAIGVGDGGYGLGILSLDGDFKLTNSTATPFANGDYDHKKKDTWSTWSFGPRSQSGDSVSANVWREPIPHSVGLKGKTPEGARRIRGTHCAGKPTYFGQSAVNVVVQHPASRPRSCSDAAAIKQLRQRHLQQPQLAQTSIGSYRSTPSPRLTAVPAMSSSGGGGGGLLDAFRSASSASSLVSSSVSSRFFQPAAGMQPPPPPPPLPNPRFLGVTANGCQTDTLPSDPAELLITNLDQAIDAKEMKRLLQSIFREYVMVLHVSVNVGPDGNLTAGIRVPSLQDAQFAISQLHRHRIGSKRILINVANQNAAPPLNVIRSQVLGLLMDVPGKRLPLFKFRELFEGRYSHSIGTAELHRISDVVHIQEHVSGRMVVLVHDYRNTPSPACSDGSREVQEILEMARCEIHCQNQDDGKGWAEKEQAAQLPNVDISLRTMATNIHSLLQSHADSIPLNSLPTCYECEFGKMKVMVDGGVPLEHLVTCVPGVHIVKDSSGVRRLEWTKNKNIEQAELRVSPPLICSLTLFCREYVDLLRSQPSCRIAFTKFIPAYHHHFGRQCRVADYGYTKLLDLLEALAHVVQILGDGNRRFLTLTHRTQIKRFTADLLRVLKAQQSKRVTLTEFPEVYAQVMEKPLDMFNYGVCQLEDMLTEISEGAILVVKEGFETVMSIPKREQTIEEVERTKKFSSEVIELLRNSPRCRMNFTKFIPAYHHHFGRQCRVADYGFSRLIELFEAIPDVVNIKPSDEEEDEKVLQLVQTLMLQELTQQATHILKVSGRAFLTLERFLATFIQLYGYTFCPDDFEAADVREVLDRIEHEISVVDRGFGPVVMTSEFCQVIQLSLRVRQILTPLPDCQMTLLDFCKAYSDVFGVACVLGQINSDLADVVTITGSGVSGTIQLVPLQILAKEIALLLHDKGGRIKVIEFPPAFFATYGRPCSPAEYGFGSLAELLRSLPCDVVEIKGRNAKRSLVLGNQASFYLPKRSEESRDASTNNIDMNGTDLLGVIPPNDRLPSPSLLPFPVANATYQYYTPPEKELIRFESPLTVFEDRATDGQASTNAANSHETMYVVMQPTTRPTSPFFPPPSLVPPIPTTWMYKQLPNAPSPPPMQISHEIENGTPSTPTGCGAFSELDSSENEMSTPPCVREVITPSSPDSTPTHNSVYAIKGPSKYYQHRTSRLAAQFSNLPLIRPTIAKSSTGTGN